MKIKRKRSWWHRIKEYFLWSKAHDLWYGFKCWAWGRYSTVRPRWLPHTYVDPDVLLAHCMFEILGRHLEEMRGLWDYDNGNDQRTPQELEMIEHWKWWTETYLKSDEQWDKRYAVIESPKLNHEPYPVPGVDGCTRLTWTFSSPEAEAAWDAYIQDRTVFEVELEAELKRRMKKLVDLKDGMWC